MRPKDYEVNLARIREDVAKAFQEQQRGTATISQLRTRLKQLDRYSCASSATSISTATTSTATTATSTSTTSTTTPASRPSSFSTHRPSSFSARRKSKSSNKPKPPAELDIDRLRKRLVTEEATKARVDERLRRRLADLNRMEAEYSAELRSFQYYLNNPLPVVSYDNLIRRLNYLDDDEYASLLAFVRSYVSTTVLAQKISKLAAVTLPKLRTSHASVSEQVAHTTAKIDALDQNPEEEGGDNTSPNVSAGSSTGSGAQNKTASIMVNVYRVYMRNVSNKNEKQIYKTKLSELKLKQKTLQLKININEFLLTLYQHKLEKDQQSISNLIDLPPAPTASTAISSLPAGTSATENSSSERQTLTPNSTATSTSVTNSATTPTTTTPTTTTTTSSPTTSSATVSQPVAATPPLCPHASRANQIVLQYLGRRRRNASEMDRLLVHGGGEHEHDADNRAMIAALRRAIDTMMLPIRRLRVRLNRIRTDMERLDAQYTRAVEYLAASSEKPASSRNWLLVNKHRGLMHAAKTALSARRSDEERVRQQLGNSTFVLRLFQCKLTNYLAFTRDEDATKQDVAPGDTDGDAQEDGNGEGKICGDCVICMGDIEEKNAFSLPCSHTFHRVCALKWLQLKTCCPVCKLAVSWNDDRSGIVAADTPEVVTEPEPETVDNADADALDEVRAVGDVEVEDDNETSAIITAVSAQLAEVEAEVELRTIAA